MNTRLILLSLSLAGWAGLLSAQAAEPTRPPNIIVIIADDLGYADIGVQGCTDIPTPNIDSIARSGIRFTQGYVSAPVCSPSRAGLMTGRYQTRFGHEFNHPLADRAPVGLPLTEKTAAQLFQHAGYVTGHVGKWHLGNPRLAQFSPKERGFDESVWFPGQRKLPPLQFFLHDEHGKADDRYVDEAIAREACGFIGKHRAEPWFLYVAFLTPHQPLDTPPGAEEPFAKIPNNERRKCAAMVSVLDASVGRILKTLRESGQEERTLIVFLSDNGAPPKNGSRNTPLRGNKGTTWEGGIREPFVMQWKGALPAGRVVDAPVISLDLLPTAIAAAGVATPAGTRFDGVNLLPFLTGKTSEPPHPALFWRYGDQMAVRQGDWKLTRALDATASPPALKTGLFNLREDAGEQHDLSAAQPAQLKQLQSLWDTWNGGNVKALWGGNSGDSERSQPAVPAAPATKAALPSDDLRIASDFPGGNIVLEKIEGDDVYVHQDLRDTLGDWFYWYFAVRGAQGHELTFHFTQSRAVGLLGPGVSRDGGRSWQWLGRTESPNLFKYKFGPDESEVRFSFGMPYQQADLVRFLDKHKQSPYLKREGLGKTRKGTPLELLRIGHFGAASDCKVLVTVRHHACEMMASYVAEGLMEEFLGDSETGVWLQAHVECAVIPMVDLDGVEDGDQGKNRQPHDHKADYRGQSIYPEVAALRAFVEKWCGGRPDASLDLHNPYINGRVIYTHALRTSDSKSAADNSRSNREMAKKYLETLEQVQQGPLKFLVQDSIDFAARISSKNGSNPKETAAATPADESKTRRPGRASISIGFEIPYAVVGDVPVTPESARAFGHDIARALAAYLKASR